MWQHKCLLRRLVSYLDRHQELVCSRQWRTAKEGLLVHVGPQYRLPPSYCCLYSRDTSLSCARMTMAVSPETAHDRLRGWVFTLLSPRAPQSEQNVGTWLPLPRFQMMRVRATGHRTQTQENCGHRTPALEGGLRGELR